MGFYSRHIVPWIIERNMSRPDFQKKRREILSSARGRVLEIGFGTGLNLPEYPKNVEEIVALDDNPGMDRYAQKRIKKSVLRVRHVTMNAERLLFPDENFNTVISTWTLCSIPDVKSALREIHRVLRRDGVFLFIEHGLSEKLKIQKWQHRLTPLWKKVGGGCHLDRNILKLLTEQSFQLIDYKEYIMPKTPNFLREMFQGKARKV